MSFVTQQDVFDAVEPVMRGVFEEFAGGKPVTPKFPMIPYATAIKKYGTDKPDLRNPIEMQNVSEAFRGSGFKIFAGMLAQDGKNEVWAIPAPKGGNRAFCDRMNAWAQHEGQPGLGYIFWREGEESGAGPLAKNIGPERTKQIADQLGLGVGDAVFFIAGKPQQFVKFAGPARTKVGEEGPRRQGPLRLLLDRRLPDVRIQRGGEEDRLLPQPVLDATWTLTSSQTRCQRPRQDPRMKAIQYDIVCNGVELSSARSEITAGRDEEGLRHRRLSRGVLEEKFGGMLRALSLGAPPHGGIAPASTASSCCVRRGEPARSRAVPDEPARRGLADGRAVGGDAEATARTAHPPELPDKK